MQPETPTPNETPRNNSQQTESVHNNTSNDSSEQKQEVQHGALQKALLRTLRKDISSTLNTTDKKTLDAYVPEGSVHTSSLPPTPPKQPPPPKDAIVHTLSDDVTELVRNRKLSLVRMAALENSKSPRTITPPKDPWKLTVRVLLVVFMVTAVIVAGAGGYYAYRVVGQPAQTPSTSGLLFTEGRETLNISDYSVDAFRTLFDSARNVQTFVVGSLTEIVLIQTPQPKTLTEQPRPQNVSVRDFFAFLETRSPQMLIDNLGDAYMLGIHARASRNEPFLILTPSSYSFAFSGMLDWESSMPYDLAGIFIPKGVTPQKSFKDEVYNNIDVRVLYDTSGSELIVYGFVQRTALIITTNKNTLGEIAERLRVQSGY